MQTRKLASAVYFRTMPANFSAVFNSNDVNVCTGIRRSLFDEPMALFNISFKAATNCPFVTKLIIVFIMVNYLFRTRLLLLN